MGKSSRRRHPPRGAKRGRPRGSRRGGGSGSTGRSEAPATVTTPTNIGKWLFISPFFFVNNFLSVYMS